MFGRRQDPDGAYAAVIPKWTSSLIAAEPVFINGDGETSHDFRYVADAVQANIPASVATEPEARNPVYNVAVGDRTTLKQLYGLPRDGLKTEGVRNDAQPTYRDFRAGDVRHSQPDISKARRLLGYEPSHTLKQGLDEALTWYVSHR